MKQITREITKVVVEGWQANDGTMFASEEECKKYEQSAMFAIENRFKALTVKQGDDDKSGFFPECEIFENYGYGSEDFMMAILDIKSKDDLIIVDMWRKMHLSKTDLEKEEYNLDESYVGKKVLVSLGYCFDNFDQFCVVGTLEDLVRSFESDVNKVFYPCNSEEN